MPLALKEWMYWNLEGKWIPLPDTFRSAIYYKKNTDELFYEDKDWNNYDKSPNIKTRNLYSLKNKTQKQVIYNDVLESCSETPYIIRCGDYNEDDWYYTLYMENLETGNRNEMNTLFSEWTRVYMDQYGVVTFEPKNDVDNKSYELVDEKQNKKLNIYINSFVEKYKTKNNIKSSGTRIKRDYLWKGWFRLIVEFDDVLFNFLYNKNNLSEDPYEILSRMDNWLLDILSDKILIINSSKSNDTIFINSSLNEIKKPKNLWIDFLVALPAKSQNFQGMALAFDNKLKKVSVININENDITINEEDLFIKIKNIHWIDLSTINDLRSKITWISWGLFSIAKVNRDDSKIDYVFNIDWDLLIDWREKNIGWSPLAIDWLWYFSEYNKVGESVESKQIIVNWLFKILSEENVTMEDIKNRLTSYWQKNWVSLHHRLRNWSSFWNEYTILFLAESKGSYFFTKEQLFDNVDINWKVLTIWNDKFLSKNFNWNWKDNINSKITEIDNNKIEINWKKYNKKLARLKIKLN